MPSLEAASLSIKPIKKPAESNSAGQLESASDLDKKSFNQQLDEAINKTSRPTDEADHQMQGQDESQDKTADVNSETVLNSSLSPETGLDIESVEEENAVLSAGNSLPTAVIASAVIADGASEPGTEDVTKVTSSLLTSSPQTNVSLSLQSDRASAGSVMAASPEITDAMETEFSDFTDELIKNNSDSSKQASDNLSGKQELLETLKPVRTQNVSLVSASAVNLSSEPTTKEFSNQLTQQLQLSTPVQQKQWGQEFVQRMSMLITNGQQQVAELQLNPARMGSIAVRVQIDDDKANVSFVTSQLAVKEAIEVSLPRLREQLEQQGLDLGHVDVSSQESEQAEEDNVRKQFSSQEDSEELNSTQTEVVSMGFEQSDGVSVFV